MARYLLIALAVVLAAIAAGCLRQNFDLCDDDPPHPDCTLVDAGRRDAGPDAGTDLGADAAMDGAAEDADP